MLTRRHLSCYDWLRPDLHIGCKLWDSIVAFCKIETKSSHPGQVVGLLVLLPLLKIVAMQLVVGIVWFGAWGHAVWCPWTCSYFGGYAYFKIVVWFGTSWLFC